MAPYLRVPRVLWFSLLVASLLYPCILWLVRSRGLPPPPPPSVLAPALSGAALAAGVMSFVLPRVQLASALAPFASRVEQQAGAAPWPGYRSKVEGERVLRLADADRRALAKAYQTSLVIALALSESVALLGFVLGFLGFPAAAAAPLSVAGTLLIAARFPTERGVLGPLERVHGARVELDAAGV